VQGAAVVELNTQTRLAEAFLLDVLLHPRLLRWRQMAEDHGPGRGFVPGKNSLADSPAPPRARFWRPADGSCKRWGFERGLKATSSGKLLLTALLPLLL